MKRDGACRSLWQHNMPGYETKPYLITNDSSFDIVIVGAGITGITTGLLLQLAGKKCLIAEAQTIGFGTTGGTTAHLNTLLDTPYTTIIKNFGEKDAQQIADGVKAALDLIRSNIDKYQIDCEFAERNACLFAQNEQQSDELDKIVEATTKAGVKMEYTDEVPVPIPFTKAAVAMNQASFHPAKYIYALAKAYEDAGGILLQHCRVTAVSDDDPLSISTTQGTFRAADIIYATHIPPGVNLLHFRCAPYRSYAMAVTLNDENYPGNLAYDMYDPYHYYRTQIVDGKNYLIAGGLDHKTGHEQHTENCFDKLEAYIKQYFDVAEVNFKWSSQYFEATDGMPYIGHLPGHPSHYFVATGFGGNGMIFGTLSAILLRDMFTGKKNNLVEILDPNRIKPVAGFATFMKEAADVTGILIASVFPGAKLNELSSLAAGEARIVKYEGSSMAVYKDENGHVHAVNPACTHIKCDVAWNDAERSWDCPCHGSRFSYDGEMLTGPARKDLAVINVSELVEESAKK